MSKSILVIQDLLPEQLEELIEIARDYEIVHSADEVEIEDIEIIFGWSDNLLPVIESDQCRVKWIQYPFAGVDILPLNLFAQKNIILTNGSGVHAHAVTETTIGLLLGMTRNIVTAAKNQAQSKWVNVDNLYELNNKTMLIVGAGKIGIQLGRVAQAFGMKTVGINRSGREIANMDEQYLQKDLPEVIGKADIIVNILPATKDTKHLFDNEMFSLMKNEAIFINVGRGETVVTADLLEALNSGKLLFAGLDVFEEEPLPENHPLWSHEKVLMTPHIAGRVENYPRWIYPIFKKNFVAFIQGNEMPENKVELAAGY